ADRQPLLGVRPRLAPPGHGRGRRAGRRMNRGRKIRDALSHFGRRRGTDLRRPVARRSTMPAPGPAPRLMEIFSEALELTTAEERAAYLDRVCGSDRSLRGRVEGLLGAHVEGDSFLESPAAAPTVTATPGGRIGPEEPGTTIGPYKLLE